MIMLTLLELLLDNGLELPGCELILCIELKLVLVYCRELSLYCTQAGTFMKRLLSFLC